MAVTFKVFSALLSYPSEDLQQAAPEMRAAIEAEGLLPAAARRGLDTLIEEMASGDFYDLQERYVLLFDRTRSLSLHLFEHVHGESRDRGQAMIDLQDLYMQKGLAVAGGELPDFLPLFLEFLAMQPPREACELLSQPAHILSALAERLRKRDSAYAAVFRALVALAATKPSKDVVATLLEEPDPDADDLTALDEAWEDQPVHFGPSASACKDGLIARVRAGQRPAPGMPDKPATRPQLPRS